MDATKKAKVEASESKSYAVYEPTNPPVFKPWTFELEPLGDHDVEIKITHSGICHSDIHTVNGDWGNKLWPCVPGHEIIGYVTQVGPRVSKWKIGDRVGVGPQALSCGNCNECNSHNESYCSVFIGTYASKKPTTGYITKGGYAEFHRTHENFIASIPKGLPSDVAAPLLCAGVTVYSPLKHHKIGPGSKVAIVGIGGLGHLGIMFAAKMGAEVTAISTSPNKEAEAKSFGAKHFISSTNEEQMNAAKKSFDFMLTTVSAHMDWKKLASLMKIDSVICNVGAPPGTLAIDPFVLLKRLSITGSLIGSPSEIQEMLYFAEKHNVHPLIEKTPFDKVNEAIHRVEANQARYRIVLEIDPNYKPVASL